MLLKNKDLIKNIKKYALISLGIGSLLFGTGKNESKNTDSHETASIVQTTSINTEDNDVSAKINYIVENMMEIDEGVSQSKIDKQKLKKITSDEKKSKIRENLKKYTSVPLGFDLLSKLNVKDILFIDTLNAQEAKSSLEGVFSKDSKSLSLDFENSDSLHIIHHELTHALQAQQRTIAAKNQLQEIDAHLNEVKFTQQAVKMGVFSGNNFSSNSMLYNYQKYNGNDVEYIQKFLYPYILWNPIYNSSYINNDSSLYEGLPPELLKGVNTSDNTINDYLVYAQSLGANQEDAKRFAKTLSQNSVEFIEYDISAVGEGKTTIKGDLKSPHEKIEETFIPDENLHTTRTYTRNGDNWVFQKESSIKDKSSGQSNLQELLKSHQVKDSNLSISKIKTKNFGSEY